MRQIREVLRLTFEAKLNERQIAKICSVGKGTVRRYLQRVAAAGCHPGAPDISTSAARGAGEPSAAGLHRRP
jgi:transposase